MERFGVALTILIGLVIILAWHDGAFCVGDLCQAQWKAQIDRSASFNSNLAPAPATGPGAFVPQAAPAAIPAATDAVKVMTYGRGICRPGDDQYRWHGRSDWCMPPARSAQSRLIDHGGKLAWFDP